MLVVLHRAAYHAAYWLANCIGLHTAAADRLVLGVGRAVPARDQADRRHRARAARNAGAVVRGAGAAAHRGRVAPPSAAQGRRARAHDSGDRPKALRVGLGNRERSEEHTSELQSLMRISYAVFCLKKTHQTQTPMQHQSTRAQTKTNKSAI